MALEGPLAVCALGSVVAVLRRRLARGMGIA
jgi:hypothetical protein